jgi:hypothetical protein
VTAITTATATHAFYSPTGTAVTYDVDSGPFSCGGVTAVTPVTTFAVPSTSGVLTAQGGYTPITAGVQGTATAGPATAQGGFADIGFYPKGSLYFYYGVGANSGPYEVAPTTGTTASTYTQPTVATPYNSACGAGYVAIAATNFTGSNPQMYAVDDFTSTATLITGTSY